MKLLVFSSLDRFLRGLPASSRATPPRFVGSPLEGYVLQGVARRL
jgi:hypothetical protein